MDLAQIKELLKIVAESGMAEVEVEEDGFKVVVRKNAATVMMPAPPVVPVGLNYTVPDQAVPVPAVAASPPAVPAGEAGGTAAPPDEGVMVRAPIVGTYFQAPAPDADPYVQVGDAVKLGDVLCIIEAMKLMNEIECEVAGTIREILVQNTEPVEYDQPLFVIEPS